MVDDIFVIVGFYIDRRFKLESFNPFSYISTITSRHQSIYRNSTKDEWEIYYQILPNLTNETIF